jgi:hypothetical protein
MANSTAVYLPTPHILRTFGDSVPDLARLVIYKNIDHARVHILLFLFFLLGVLLT